MNEKKNYVVRTAMNFSIGGTEYYLQPGDEVELPDHELVTSLLVRKHIELKQKTEKKETKPITK